MGNIFRVSYHFQVDNYAAPRKHYFLRTRLERILNELDTLFEVKKIYKNNTISLLKLAKHISTSTHALSQVINENKHKTFFELLGYYRIKEAKELLLKSKSIKVADIAFDVGYNSLSAFNSAFKKETNQTPSQFRNGN